MSGVAGSSLGELLGRAFVGDPVLRHAEPDAGRRARWMAALYGTFVRYAAARGGVEVIDGKGGALWLQDETQPSFWRGLLHGSIRLASSSAGAPPGAV